jgi:hypothetical protein
MNKMCLGTKLTVLATLAFATSCKDKAAEPAKKADKDTADAGKQTGSGGAAGAAVAPAPVSDATAMIPAGLPAAFTAWDLPARAKLWQGAMMLQPSLGFNVATGIVGKTATTWDGKVEKTLELEIESPCSIRFIENVSGGKSATTTHFTVRGGKLLQGLGDAGSRNGKTAIACISNAILTLDDTGKCTEWSSMFGKFEQAEGKCGFAQKDGKEVFTAKVNGMNVALTIDGDAMFSEQLGNTKQESFTDFAAAKAARDAAK